MGRISTADREPEVARKGEKDYNQGLRTLVHKENLFKLTAEMMKDWQEWPVEFVTKDKDGQDTTW